MPVDQSRTDPIVAREVARRLQQIMSQEAVRSSAPQPTHRRGEPKPLSRKARKKLITARRRRLSQEKLDSKKGYRRRRKKSGLPRGGARKTYFKYFPGDGPNGPGRLDVVRTRCSWATANGYHNSPQRAVYEAVSKSEKAMAVPEEIVTADRIVEMAPEKERPGLFAKLWNWARGG